jgi:hypothetical protein
LSGEKIMANVHIEARPKGRQEGTSIEDYVLEEQGDRVLKTFKTQAEAISARPASERQEDFGPVATGLGGEGAPTSTRA